MKIYVASSWKNSLYPVVLSNIVNHFPGDDVYDFRNPAPDVAGFAWEKIDPDWHLWTSEEFAEALEHPAAQAAFSSDMNALAQADVCVLVLPCNRSAHLELGYAIGTGKRTIIFTLGNYEPELMYKMADTIVHSTSDLIGTLRIIRDGLELVDALRREAA